MTKAAGGIVDVADIPVVGVTQSIPANTGGGYTASLAGATLFIGGTHVILSGTITRAAGLERNITLGTVPVGLRPSQTRRVVCALGNAGPTGDQSGSTAVQVLTTGEIRLTGASGIITTQTVAYLDAIMYAL